jgi:hypothetical protein
MRSNYFLQGGLAPNGFACIVLAVLALCPKPAFAERRSGGSPLTASTSVEARRDAIRSIPLQKISTKYRTAVREVLDDPSLYRRMPTSVIDCNPQLFTFLAQNPEVLVEMWQELGISTVELKRIGGATFELSDHAGTTGKLTIVEQKCDDRAQNRIVMFVEGRYEGKPFRRPLKADCVLVLRSGSLREENGRDYVAARLDSFVRIDRASIELFAKAMHPWVGRTADANFADTMTFVSSFSRASETRPDTIEHLVGSLDQLPVTQRVELLKLACGAPVAATGPTRVAARPGDERKQ